MQISPISIGLIYSTYYVMVTNTPAGNLGTFEINGASNGNDR